MKRSDVISGLKRDHATPHSHEAIVSPAGMRWALRKWDRVGSGDDTFFRVMAGFWCYRVVEHLVDPLWEKERHVAPEPQSTIRLTCGTCGFTAKFSRVNGEARLYHIGEDGVYTRHYVGFGAEGMTYLHRAVRPWETFDRTAGVPYGVVRLPTDTICKHGTNLSTTWECAKCVAGEP